MGFPWQADLLILCLFILVLFVLYLYYITDKLYQRMRAKADKTLDLAQSLWDLCEDPAKFEAEKQIAIEKELEQLYALRAQLHAKK